MSLRKMVVTASLVVIASAAAPTWASADWLFTPFIGSTFGGSANIGGEGEAFKDEFERKLNYGASIAWMGGGALGFEFDFGYSPNFFGVSPDNTGLNLVGDGNVTTLMANLVVGAPLGGVRPYASGGIGILKSKVEDPAQFFDKVDATDLGLNAGAGVIGFFAGNVGLRGDLRYFRSLQNNDVNGVDLALGQFNFWRGTVGLTFRF